MDGQTAFVLVVIESFCELVRTVRFVSGRQKEIVLLQVCANDPAIRTVASLAVVETGVGVASYIVAVSVVVTDLLVVAHNCSLAPRQIALDGERDGVTAVHRHPVTAQQGWNHCFSKNHYVAPVTLDREVGIVAGIITIETPSDPSGTVAPDVGGDVVAVLQQFRPNNPALWSLVYRGDCYLGYD